MDLRGERILVTGATGQLGRYVCSAGSLTGGEIIRLARREGAGADVACDLADREQTLTAVSIAEPTVIIHAAACTDVDGIEREPARGEIDNRHATENIANAARACGAYLVAVSTDMVFPGDGGAPYSERAKTAPISAYGRSKRAAEEAIQSIDPSFAIVRTAWLYGGAGKHFPRTVLTVLRDRGSIEVVNDEFGSPTFAGDLAWALLHLANRRGGGVFHLINEGRASRFDLAAATAVAAGLDPSSVKPIDTPGFLAKYPLPARRPADSTLLNGRASELGITLRGWRDAVREYVPSLAAEILNRPETR
ncbi:MAG: dTDP-4-dehydrorhamnose reductase [Thermomicrobiales bacterium]